MTERAEKATGDMERQGIIPLRMSGATFIKLALTWCWRH
jgi:hypothetical protein